VEKALKLAQPDIDLLVVEQQFLGDGVIFPGEQRLKSLGFIGMLWI